VEYDIYGKVRKFEGRSLTDCPFRYQGQYEDVETGLYYNRFRYYSPDSGTYISQDPIGLDGGISNHYSYSSDSNKLIDIFGLSSNSALLGSNLGPSPGSNHDARHIVMTGTKNPKMNSLVDQMKTHGIDPDGKQNGIWLARTDADKIPGVSPNTSHKQDGLHGNAYKDELFDRLDGKNKKDFKKEMGKIKQELKAGRTWDTATPKKLGKTCR
uniref:RHS repeat-associated core domain-containing protein n=1 Tax=uncultured Maribacter sp. TaxID=431308 RepID=UPI00262CE043